MKNNTWNPTRRNKNIGTKKSGRSKNNELVISDRWSDYRIYWERLSDPVICPVKIKGHDITLFVEPTKDGYVHACTPDDIIRVLELVIQEHLEEIDLVVLRQPKKKEEILKPVWGRFVYYADFGRYSGPGVYIEATPVGKVLHWSNKLDPYKKKELAALEKDGHRVEHTKRGYIIHTTLETCRATQLFRTLPHEIGHAVDYLTHSINPSVDAKTEVESDYITNTYDAKPSLDKEEYAHRYAREFYEKHKADGALPFERILNEDSLRRLGLKQKWFEPALGQIS